VESAYINDVEYSCSGCHRRLLAEDDGWLGWVLCPECAKPGLPPARLGRQRQPQRPALPAISVSPRAAGVLDPISAEDHPAEFAVGSEPLPARPVSSAPRLIVRTGLVVSLVLLLFAYLERSTPNAAVFGFLSVVFLVLLIWLPRAR
jgi:hypothetical protein